LGNSALLEGEMIVGLFILQYRVCCIGQDNNQTTGKRIKMKVIVKDLAATIELKQNGIELEIRDPKNTFLGDLVITSTSIIWCNGKTKRENGVKISIPDFIKQMNTKPAKAVAKPKAAKAAKAVAPKIAKVAKIPKGPKAAKVVAAKKA
jgi:hypothetical protein